MHILSGDSEFQSPLHVGAAAYLEHCYLGPHECPCQMTFHSDQWQHDAPECLHICILLTYRETGGESKQYMFVRVCYHKLLEVCAASFQRKSVYGYSMPMVHR